MVTQIYCNASRVDKLRVVFRGLCFVVLSDFARLSAGIGLVIFFEKIFRGRSNPTSPNTHPHSNLDNPPQPHSLSPRASLYATPRSRFLRSLWFIHSLPHGEKYYVQLQTLHVQGRHRAPRPYHPNRGRGREGRGRR